MGVQKSTGFEQYYRTIVRETLFPLALMFATFNSAVILPYIVINKNSNLSSIDREGKT